MDLIENIASKFHLKSGFELKILSEIPAESGMSSSTAVTAATIKSISGLFGLEIPNETFFELIYPVQVAIHGGRASGAEIISSVYGGFHKIQKIAGDKQIKWDFLYKTDFSVVIGYTKVRAKTSLTVGSHVPSVFNRNPDLVDTAFHSIAYLNDKMIAAIKDRDLVKIGNIIDVDHEILSKLLGLSHPKLEDCIYEAKRAGALGAKLSGGGWGGAMFALVRPEDSERVAKAITTTGADAIVTELGVEGVRIEK